jgi:cobalamin biosynthesis Mg chelatase CobN
MFETRQNLAPARGGHIFALSVLALLAMCCVPVLAQASSAGYQYSDAPPTVTGGKPPSQSNLSGGSKSTSGIGSPAGSAKSSGGKSSGGGNGSQANSNGSGGGNAAGQQGSQGNGGQKSSAGAGNANGGSPEPGSSGGGSSPLVPILIAIVLLAGGSIGYVLMKRRQRKASGSPDSPGSDSSGSSGSSVSPEAG